MIASAGTVLLFSALLAQAQAVKRCDLLLNYTSTPANNAACLNLVDSNGVTPGVLAAGNATRIAYDGVKLCKNAFQVTRASEADIVFILDNTGSMLYGDSHFCSYPGDPTSSRASVVKSGMDLEHALAVTATAGFIAFNGPDTSGVQSKFLQPSLDISASNPLSASNLNLLKSKVIADNTIALPNNDSCNQASTIPDDWYPSFKLALGWLSDTALIRSQNHAIILISDGGVEDFSKVKNLVGRLPPVFGIHLGSTLNNQGLPDQASSQLIQLTQLTGGQFYLVTPTDTVSMRLAMENIISRVVARAVPPASLQIRNTVSNQTSRGVSMAAAADGNLNVILDSSLTLQKGVNNFQASITLGDNTVHKYSFEVQADDADASQDAAGLACYDLSVLVMLNANGQQDPNYASGAKSYGVKLTHSPSELTDVSAIAISSDSIKALGWGDIESIPLSLSSASPAEAVNQTLVPYPFDGRSGNPVPNNGKLESDANGQVLLTWTHPRDSRDVARYLLSGRGNILALERLKDVFQGVFVNPANSNPVVVNKGLTFTGNNSDIRITSRGQCVYNCSNNPTTNEGILGMPSFVVNAHTPFKFSLFLYDNAGQFINKAVDSINTSSWQNFPAADSVVISLLPITSKGKDLGTGVYYLRATITTLPGVEAPVTTQILKQFGYVAPSGHGFRH